VAEGVAAAVSDYSYVKTKESTFHPKKLPSCLRRGAEEGWSAARFDKMVRFMTL
jgi:hypothetical protein